MGKREIDHDPEPPGSRALLRVTALASDGAGIARLPDGRVVFVEAAAPGDLVLPGPLARHRGALRAPIERLVEPGADRVAPRCVHFGSCGGCVWQHVRYPAQLEAKRQNVRAALERIGGLRLEGPVEIVASPDALHYRARTRVVEAPGGVGYRRRGSHAVLCVQECPVLVPSAQAALAALGARVAAEQAATQAPAQAATRAAEAGASPARAGSRRERGASERGRRETPQVSPPREWTITAGTSPIARIDASEAADGTVGRAARATGEAASAEAEPLELEVLGERLQIGGPGFVQGNALLWDRLAREVRDRCLAPVAGHAPRRFVELYAGIGFLTLPIARAGLAGLAVESGAQAVRDLAANLARAGLAGAVEVVAARAEAVAALPDWLAACDLLLVDPPRVGLEPRVRDAIARAGPRAVVYVSCDPATLARDVAQLAAGDYRLASVLALDLFPQTPHVETIVRLERRR